MVRRCNDRTDDANTFIVPEQLSKHSPKNGESVQVTEPSPSNSASWTPDWRCDIGTFMVDCHVTIMFAGLSS